MSSKSRTSGLGTFGSLPRQFIINLNTFPQPSGREVRYAVGGVLSIHNAYRRSRLFLAYSLGRVDVSTRRFISVSGVHTWLWIHFFKYSKSKDENDSFIVYSISYSGQQLLLDLNISSTLQPIQWAYCEIPEDAGKKYEEKEMNIHEVLCGQRPLLLTDTPFYINHS